MIIGQTFASESVVSHFIALAGGDPRQYRHNDISLKTRFCGLHFRCRKCWRIFNHFYVLRPECYEVGEISRRFGLLRRSRSFKVTDFGTNRKLIYDFSLYLQPFLGNPPRKYLWSGHWSGQLLHIKVRDGSFTRHSQGRRKTD